MNLLLLVCSVFSFDFLEEIEDSKKAFRNYLTFNSSDLLLRVIDGTMCNDAK